MPDPLPPRPARPHPSRSFTPLLATVALPVLLVLPGTGRAQGTFLDRGSFLLEASGGLFHDAFAPDAGPGFDVALRFGLAGPRLRLFQEVGWGRTGGIEADPAVGTDAELRNEWLLSTTGVDLPLHRGGLDVFGRAGLGIAWIRTESDEGTVTALAGDFRARRHLVLGLVLQRDLGRELAVTLNLTDRVFDLFGSPRHGVGLSVGVLRH